MLLDSLTRNDGLPSLRVVAEHKVDAQKLAQFCNRFHPGTEFSLVMSLDIDFSAPETEYMVKVGSYQGAPAPEKPAEKPPEKPSGEPSLEPHGPCVHCDQVDSLNWVDLGDGKRACGRECSTAFLAGEDRQTPLAAPVAGDGQAHSEGD